MRLRHLALVPAALAVLMTAAAGPAAAAAPARPSADPPPYDATMVRTAPLYPSSPDGWRCHFGGACRPAGVRYDSDPAPIDTLLRGQDVQLVCDFGNYALVEIEPERTEYGWVPADSVDAAKNPVACGIPEWTDTWWRW